ncbi:MAG: quinol-cytochrome oxidoreductase complex cytochrome b subunit [Gammaproteobacteria bacterium]
MTASLVRKDMLVAQARRDIRLKSSFDSWLWLHMLLTVALLVALDTHIFAVFYYR